MKNMGLLGVIVLLLCGAFSVNATILTFNFSQDFVDINPDYGDRVTAVNSDGFSYGMGGGFTPNVVVDYAPSFGNFRIYKNGYGTLTSALGHNSFSVPGEVLLTADPGHLVTLNSFDVSAWTSSGPFSDTQVRVLDGDSVVLFDSGQFLAANNDDFSYDFSASPLKAEVLRISINDFGDMGLDNVNFDQTPVPVPTALLLFAPAVIGLGRFRRKIA